MSLKVFENKLREQCKITFCDLKDGSRLNRLLKNKKNSLLDVMYSGRKRPNPLLQSCAISFGHVLEKRDSGACWKTKQDRTLWKTNGTQFRRGMGFLGE